MSKTIDGFERKFYIIAFAEERNCGLEERKKMVFTIHYFDKSTVVVSFWIMIMN